MGHATATAAGTFERAVLHPSLANVSACLGELNAGLSVLGLGLLFVYPPAGAACLAAATVLAVAQLAVDGARRAHGEHGRRWAAWASSWRPPSRSAATRCGLCGWPTTWCTWYPAVAWPPTRPPAAIPSPSTSASPRTSCATGSPPNRTLKAASTFYDRQAAEEADQSTAQDTISGRRRSAGDLAQGVASNSA